MYVYFEGWSTVPQKAYLCICTSMNFLISYIDICIVFTSRNICCSESSACMSSAVLWNKWFDIYTSSFLQPNKPVSVIYSEQNISCAHWSLSRPLGVAVGLVTGQVVLYDFGLKNCEPSLTLPAAEKPSPITTTAFNKKK